MDWKINGSVILWTILLVLEVVVFADQQEAVDRQQRSIEELEGMLEDYIEQQIVLISPQAVELARQARKKKKSGSKKFLLPMIIGALLVKSLILPLVLKALAIMSSKAVILSMLSLIIASVLGIRRVARQEAAPNTEVQVIHVPLKQGGHKRYGEEETEEYVSSDYSSPYRAYTTDNYR